MSAPVHPSSSDPHWLATGQWSFAPTRRSRSASGPLPVDAHERMHQAASGELTCELDREARGAEEAENARLRREVDMLRRENSRLYDELRDRFVEMQRLREKLDHDLPERVRRRTATL